MFSGEFHHSFDEKFRLTVPSRFRQYCALGLHILQGFDQNLMVMDNQAFQSLYQNINQMNLLDPDARYFRRFVLGSAVPVELDKSGRILVPEELRSWAELGTDVVILGQGNYFEIMRPELWAEFKTNSKKFDNDRVAALSVTIQ